ncbi:serine hydrolase [Streptomyces pacificus]|uniref:Serine hydrolase n=1 Tax=Streptomyces pacificus TaxID=2705029 RepID=A0A6A0B443_9ACTN|nr:serine hydrolase [Streptomyces pacificus]GFH39094.1 serine hydrolase [Streptomyces pacificus]
MHPGKGPRPSRGRPLAIAGLAALLLAATALTPGADGPRSASGPAPSPSEPLPKPPSDQPPPLLTRADVDRAVARLDGVVRDMMKETGVPGVAVGVVHQDRVLYLKGFGERHVGEPAAVDPDTVFQLASLSKPIGSTVVAGAVEGEGDEAGDGAAGDGAGAQGADERDAGWDAPVARHLPGFALKDPWVSGHVTVTDLLSHRSGLPDHAGDLLEDLGYDQAYILSHLRDEPLAPFRAAYAYTNFGFTAGAEAVARAKGVSWQKLSEDTLFRPAGMDSTSTTFADYEKAANRAVAHVPGPDGTWQAKYVRNADAQAPAGGASSSAADMMRWLRLQLAGGKLDGRQIIDAESLRHTHLPEIVSQPPRSPAGRTGFYGLGWNVTYDDQARLRLGHSGAFELGANTHVTMLPGEQLGIVVLTNGKPVGLADAVAEDFFDTAQYGKPSRDWLRLFAALYAQLEEAGVSPTDYADPPDSAKAARPGGAYAGTYDSTYYGKATVTDGPDGLVLELGPEPKRFPLRHYDGDTFSFETAGENAVGPTGATFTFGRGDTARKLRVEYLDGTGLGTFTRH